MTAIFADYFSEVETRPHLFLLENIKKCPGFKDKHSGSFHLWLKSIILNADLRGSRREKF